MATPTGFVTQPLPTIAPLNGGGNGSTTAFASPALPAAPSLTSPAAPKMTSGPATPPAPAAPSTGSYTIAAGDTLSAIAAKNGMQLSDLLASNPQFQANPNMIKPGQTVNLAKSAGPAFVTQSRPQVSLHPNIVTPSGATVNPSTGALVAPPPGGAPPATPAVPVVPPTAPAAPATPPPPTLAETDAAAAKAYQDAQNMSPDEVANQQAIDDLESSAGLSKANIGHQAIPLPFITGQQKAVEDRALALEAPLQKKAALLQAQRTASINASKFALDRADAAVAAAAAAKKPVSVASGSDLIDPTTGKVIASGQAKPVSVSAGGTLVDPTTGKVVYSSPAGGASTVFGGTPTVGMNADNTVDAKTQAAFLASPAIGGANSELGTLIKGISNYTINPNSIPTRQYRGVGGLTQAEVVALASQYDPSYDSKQYSTRQALIKNFTSGNYSQNINALNTVTGHLGTLTDTFNKLGNANFTPYNFVKNSVLPVFGINSQAGAGLNLSAVSGELANIFKKSGATDVEIKNLGTLNNNSTPADLKSYIDTASHLMQSRISALSDTYTSGMGKAPPTPFLSQNSVKTLQKLQAAGFDVGDLAGTGNTGGAFNNSPAPAAAGGPDVNALRAKYNY
jgi:LysM repeat protein